MQLTEPIKFNLPTLAERAMLVRIKRSMYQPYAFDRDTTAKVEAETGVRKAGRFNKRLLLDCYELKQTNSAFNDVYQYGILHTVPWLDDGVRMLPAPGYFEFTSGVRELINTANREADNLAAKWDQIVARDMLRLGPLADINDYPTDIRAHYRIELKFMPVPSTDDFRLGISDEDRQSLNSAIQEAEANVSKYLITELLEPIKNAVEKLAIPIGEKGSVFRDTLVGNIANMTQRARKLNISNDPTINELVDEINSAVRVYVNAPDLLREDVGARVEAQTRLNDIMAKMAGLF